MRLWVLALSWLVASVALAQPAGAKPWVDPGMQPAETAPPEVGTCLGGSCRPGAQQVPAAAESEAAEGPRRPRRAARFAYAGALLGAVSAGLLLGGAIAIAGVDHPASERITRGLWFGELAVATPLVALSAFTARRHSSFAGYKGLRSLGWVSYGAALSDGVLLWYSAFRDLRMPPALTVAAGAIACFALLPHALDALISARKARFGGFALHASPRGIGVTF